MTGKADARGRDWRRQPLVVQSADDPAGCNIARHLLHLARFERGDLDGMPFWVGSGQNLLSVKGRLVDQDGLDQRAARLGLRPPLLLFASRHRSPDGRAVLTAHHTGNPGPAELGGRPGELARPAPAALKTAFLALARHCPPGFQVTLEATHHGPSALDLPSLFVEIGSGDAQWGLPAPGEAVARALLEVCAEPAAAPPAAVLVSFGGTHYAPRQGRILAETSAAFGHVFADHSLAHVDERVVRLALELSGTRLAHLDRKALAAAERERLLGLLERCGATVVGEGELRRRWPAQAARCPLAASRPSTPGGLRVDVTPAMARALEGCACPSPDATPLEDPATGSADCPGLEEAGLDADVVGLCLRLDRKGALGLLSDLPLAYHLPSRAGDASRAWAVRGDRETPRRLADGLLALLSARGSARFDPETATLSIVERRFDPDRARALGVPPGPLFARLASGEAVDVDGRRVVPSEVLMESVTRVRLRHFSVAAAALFGGDAGKANR